ncbi:TraR/DksA family transcriptional regulator [Escherichia coli]|uniref:TraR/DksA family transcriptional regulator n=1 Tax=Escherichia coli TaxID=562 RepID=UPI0009413E4D|nr:RNA polymerase-binding transcription factor DksA [Escherichia coli]
MDVVDLVNEASHQVMRHSSIEERMERNGACVDCSCVIPKLRLMAMPNALRCLECQEKYEHLQKVVYRLVHS